MKKMLLTATVVVLVVMMTAPWAWAGRVGNRQVKQNERIGQGVKSGELTRFETRKLVNEQRRIQQVKRSALSDGTLTRREKVGLEVRQDKANADIYRLKHNNRDRD